MRAGDWKMARWENLGMPLGMLSSKAVEVALDRNPHHMGDDRPVLARRRKRMHNYHPVFQRPPPQQRHHRYNPGDLIVLGCSEKVRRVRRVGWAGKKDRVRQGRDT